MRYDSQLYDLPVVDRLSGELAGHMRGVVCHPPKRQIEGIVYEERGLLRRCCFVPWRAVAVIGDRSIVIDCMQKSRCYKNVACPGRDHKVYNTDGCYIGRISNYLIDEKSGAMLGMELSVSFLDDLKFGRKIIENKGNLMEGADCLMLVNSGHDGTPEQIERRSENEGLF